MTLEKTGQWLLDLLLRRHASEKNVGHTYFRSHGVHSTESADSQRNALSSVVEEYDIGRSKNGIPALNEHGRTKFPDGSTLVALAASTKKLYEPDRRDNDSRSDFVCPDL